KGRPTEYRERAKPRNHEITKREKQISSSFRAFVVFPVCRRVERVDPAQRDRQDPDADREPRRRARPERRRLVNRWPRRRDETKRSEERRVGKECSSGWRPYHMQRNRQHGTSPAGVGADDRLPRAGVFGPG